MRTSLSIILFLTIVALSSCEKVILVDLNEADRVYVIEGQITNIEDMNFIKISKSDDFYETEEFETISDATITVTDDQGNVSNFTEVSDGLYKSAGFTATSYTKYSLSVWINGEEITAETFMPGNTSIDSIPYLEGSFFGSEGFNAFLYWTDPGSERNYYKYNNWQKSIGDNAYTPDPSISITEDALFNGIGTGIPLFSRQFELGDTVIVDLMEIDEPNFKYWYALSQVTGGQTAAPGNPISNLSGGTLGYFGAYNISRDTIVIE
ncbi:MAG: DUF4249 domain-containing protein [Flavobacteriales bacterium]|nr:DUF4249 domain-containing protein [Flavobacteriales bacterium]